MAMGASVKLPGSNRESGDVRRDSVSGVVLVANASPLPSFTICIAMAGVLAVTRVAERRFDRSHASCAVRLSATIVLPDLSRSSMLFAVEPAGTRKVLSVNMYGAVKFIRVARSGVIGRNVMSHSPLPADSISAAALG